MESFQRSSAGLDVRFFLSGRIDPADADALSDVLLGRYSGPRLPSGNRSTIIPCASPGLRYDGLKVKGSGYRGGPIDFERLHRTNYPLPRYDFDGNYLPDAAANMNRAPRGGMSQQQAMNEFLVATHLVASGFRTFPAVGFGFVRKGAATSWFAVLNVPYEEQVVWMEDLTTPERVLETVRFWAVTQRDLRDLDVFLVLTGRSRNGDGLIRKDFHTAHRAAPADSFMSLLCYYLFDVNFVLYLIKVSFLVPAGDFRDAGRVAYIEALTGHRYDLADIDRFKRLLLRFKYGDRSFGGRLPGRVRSIGERVTLLRTDPIGRRLLTEFLPRDPAAAALYGFALG